MKKKVLKNNKRGQSDEMNVKRSMELENNFSTITNNSFSIKNQGKRRNEEEKEEEEKVIEMTFTKELVLENK